MKLREKRMREIMAMKKMNQADLAVAIGASPSLICHVLKGRRRLSIKYGKRLIELFGAELMSRAIDWEGMGVKAV